MYRDDLLSQVRIRARLRGPQHARRVIRAVLQALGRYLPEPELRTLTAQLPVDVGVTPPASGPAARAGAHRHLIRDIAEQLNESEPNAAFYARVTFEQLNTAARGTTPAQLTASVPAELRPLLSARTDEPAHRHRDLVRTLSGAVPSLTLRTPAAPAAPARQVIEKTVTARPKEAPVKAARPS